MMDNKKIINILIGIGSFLIFGGLISCGIGISYKFETWVGIGGIMVLVGFALVAFD